jgi:transposase
VLYNQPDFAAVKSQLETVCEAHGFKVVFLPKFHCELNFIEQCWGYAKRTYRQYPPSKDEEQLERNLLSALASIPLATMRK